MTEDQLDALFPGKNTGKGIVIPMTPTADIGLTRDQLNQVMLELQSFGKHTQWSLDNSKKSSAGYLIAVGEIRILVHAGRILARAVGIEGTTPRKGD